MANSNEWWITLVEWEALKAYDRPYALVAGRTFPNPLIEGLLPSVALVKSVAAFDEAIESYIDISREGLPKGYRGDLNGRVHFLVAQGLVENGDELHRVRRLRNRVAHDLAARATWAETEWALTELHAALEKLGVTGPRPSMEFFGERSAITPSQDPDLVGERTFTVGIKAAGNPVYEASWTEKIHWLVPPGTGPT